MVGLNRCATSTGKDPALVKAVEGMYREMSLSRPSSIEERPLECKLARSHTVKGGVGEDGSNTAPYFLLHCLKLQQMPFPSCSEVVIFRLAYLYYTNNDNLRQGQACKGLYTDLYGQVFCVDGKEAHVHFPAGIKEMQAYNHIPFLVFRNTKLGCCQEHGVFPADTFPNNNVRMVVKQVLCVGQAKPNAEELLRHEHASCFCRPSKLGAATPQAWQGRSMEYVQTGRLQSKL